MSGSSGSATSAGVVNLPNALTVTRIALVPFFVAVLLADGGSTAWLRWVSLSVFLVAMATDSIDGDLARRRGQVTTFGKVADPIADKALVGAAFIGLSMLDLVPWWVTVVVLGREIGVTVVRFLVLRHGVIPAGRGGKLKTATQSLALSLLIVPAWVLPISGLWSVAADAVLAVAVGLTVVTGVAYVAQARQVRRAGLRARANHRAAGAAEQ